MDIYVPKETDFAKEESIFTPKFASISLERSKAESLLELLKDRPEFKELYEYIDGEFKLLYNYRIECGDCSRTYLIKRKERLTRIELEGKKGVCVSCSDDYK